MGAVKYSAYQERAVEEAKIGGDVERARVFAILALAEAVTMVGDDVSHAIERLENPGVKVRR